MFNLILILMGRKKRINKENGRWETYLCEIINSSP